MALQAVPSGLLAREHTARCRVLGRVRITTDTNTPCVLASLGARDPEARQHHLKTH
jgi:hypothetical protein